MGKKKNHNFSNVFFENFMHLHNVFSSCIIHSTSSYNLSTPQNPLIFLANLPPASGLFWKKKTTQCLTRVAYMNTREDLFTESWVFVLFKNQNHKIPILWHIYFTFIYYSFQLIVSQKYCLVTQLHIWFQTHL